MLLLNPQQTKRADAAENKIQCSVWHYSCCNVSLLSELKLFWVGLAIWSLYWLFKYRLTHGIASTKLVQIAVWLAMPLESLYWLVVQKKQKYRSIALQKLLFDPCSFPSLRLRVWWLERSWTKAFSPSQPRSLRQRKSFALGNVQDEESPQPPSPTTISWHLQEH